MWNYSKCFNSIVGFIGLSVSYTFVSYLLMPIIDPYIMEGSLGFIQIFVIGFCIGYGGTALIYHFFSNL
jgi:hypothetical protein